MQQATTDTRACQSRCCVIAVTHKHLSGQKSVGRSHLALARWTAGRSREQQCIRSQLRNRLAPEAMLGHRSSQTPQQRASERPGNCLVLCSCSREQRRVRGRPQRVRLAVGRVAESEEQLGLIADRVYGHVQHEGCMARIFKQMRSHLHRG